MNKLTLGIGGFLLGTLITFGVMELRQSKPPEASGALRLQGGAARYGIYLRATPAEIDVNQWTDIVKTLNASRPDLYLIQDYADGTATGAPMGTMDVRLLLEEKRVPPHFSGHAFQIGVGGEENSRFVPLLLMPQAHFRQDMSDSSQIVNAVNKIIP